MKKILIFCGCLIALGLLSSCAKSHPEETEFEQWEFDIVSLDMTVGTDICPSDEVEPDTIVSPDGKLMFIFWRPITFAAAPAWANICIWWSEGKTYREWCEAQGFETRDYTGDNFWEGCQVWDIQPLKTRKGDIRYLILTYHKPWSGLGYMQAQVVEIDGEHIYATRAFPDCENNQTDSLLERMGIEFSLGTWAESDYPQIWYEPTTRRLFVPLTQGKAGYFDPVFTDHTAVYQWQDTAFVYIRDM